MLDTWTRADSLCSLKTFSWPTFLYFIQFLEKEAWQDALTLESTQTIGKWKLYIIIFTEENTVIIELKNYYKNIITREAYERMSKSLGCFYISS